ncbi:hypothetical protein HPP92_014671 [Vanilla planifolia]|uniref:Uncharacterized protein n=1 Tax=Vanilla planifolia TaxID=51239 RepID=A0A835QN43_VANPL|nr:hypothetical protein HPP92_014671 [Vanilla planifolia]
MASHYLFLILHFQPGDSRLRQPLLCVLCCHRPQRAVDNHNLHISPTGNSSRGTTAGRHYSVSTPSGILSVAAVLIGRRPIAVTDESPMTLSPLLLSENPLSTTSSPATTPANVHSQHLDRRRGSQPLPDALSWIREPSRGQLFQANYHMHTKPN